MNNINNEKLQRIEQNKQMYKQKYVYAPKAEDILKYGLLLPSINMIKRHIEIIKKNDKDVLRALLNECLRDLD